MAGSDNDSAQKMKTLKSSNSLRSKVFSAGLAFIVFIAGIAYTIWTVRSQDARMRDQLLTETRIAGSTIDWQLIQSLTGTESDLLSPNYLELKKQLILMHNARPHCRFMYLMGRKQDGTIFFFLDSESLQSPDYSPPGQVYTEARDELKRVFAAGRESTMGPAADRWGKWINGLVPIFDPQTKKCIALFGMDVDAKYWNRQIAGYCVMPAIVTLLLVLLLYTVFLILMRQRSLQESKERFDQLAVQSGTISWEVDASGIYTFVSHVSLTVLGYRPEEMTGRIHFYDLQYESEREAYKETVFAVFKKKEAFLNLVNTVQAKDGRQVWLSTNGIPIMDASGNLLGYRGSDTDITARIQAEQIIIESDRLLHSVVESNPEVIIFALDNQYRYLIFNNRHKEVMRQIWGKDIATCMNMIHEVIGNDADREKARKNFDRALQGERFSEIEEYGDEELGRFYWEDRYSPIYSETGTIIGLTCFVLCITDRKRAEAEKEKLEAINRQLQKEASLSRMAGAIAHKFNNLLTVVMGNLEITINNQRLDIGSLENLIEAMKSARKASELSGQMIIYLGQSTGKRELLNLSEICRNHLSILNASIPNNVILEAESLSSGTVIFANANQMQQVITNLISNAWESMGDGNGTIHLTVKTIVAAEIPIEHRFPIGWKPQDNVYICMEVADSGCGIQQKDYENLFDPFFSTKFTGRGLGLPVVLGIVRAHNGVITVESEPGHGSVFRVFLPKYGKEVSATHENEPYL